MFGIKSYKRDKPELNVCLQTPPVRVGVTIRDAMSSRARCMMPRGGVPQQRARGAMRACVTRDE
jgi:hypothetical protein